MNKTPVNQPGQVSQLRSGRMKYEVYPVSNPGQNPTLYRYVGSVGKRSFDFYVFAKGIVEDRQKVALLLHTAGQEVQYLYYTLPGPEEELRDYKDVVELFCTESKRAF